MITPKEDTTPKSVIDIFIDNINTIALNGARDQADPPLFSGTTNYNNSYGNPSVSPAFINPPAIPSADLDIKSAAVSGDVKVGSPKTSMVASVVYGTLVDITKRLTRVRKFTSTWYHKTQASYVLVNSISGKAMFKEVLPEIQGTAGVVPNTATGGWERSVNGSAVQNISVPNPGIEKGKFTLASTINQFFTNLNSSWEAAADNNISYTFYSCHNNCHSNCHSSCHGSGRSRR